MIKISNQKIRLDFSFFCFGVNENSLFLIAWKIMISNRFLRNQHFLKFLGFCVFTQKQKNCWFCKKRLGILMLCDLRFFGKMGRGSNFKHTYLSGFLSYDSDQALKMHLWCDQDNWLVSTKKGERAYRTASPPKTFWKVEKINLFKLCWTGTRFPHVQPRTRLFEQCKQNQSSWLRRIKIAIFAVIKKNSH